MIPVDGRGEVDSGPANKHGVDQGMPTRPRVCNGVLENNVDVRMVRGQVAGHVTLHRRVSRADSNARSVGRGYIRVEVKRRNL